MCLSHCQRGAWLPSLSYLIVVTQMLIHPTHFLSDYFLFLIHWREFIKQYSDPRYILTVNPSLPSAVSSKCFLSVLSGEQWRWEGFCCDWSQFSLLKPAPRGPLGLQPRLHSLCSKENDRNENNYFRKTGINNGGKPLLANRHICNPFKILNLS